MAKHLVDIDDEILDAARAQLGTTTLKQTVDVALRRVIAGRDRRIGEALDELARVRFVDRDDAWR
jgi:Arc/MetJ family transcription regulator